MEEEDFGYEGALVDRLTAEGILRLIPAAAEQKLKPDEVRVAQAQVQLLLLLEIRDLLESMAGDGDAARRGGAK